MAMAMGTNVQRLFTLVFGVGAALCAYAVNTQSFLKDGPPGDITRSLIFMETTNISFQASFVLYHELNYTAFMIPAILHFFVVRVLVLGHYIHPFEYPGGTWGWIQQQGKLSYIIPATLSLLMWVLQIGWCVLWLWKLAKHACKKEKE
jgi:hypothetical protein